VLQVEADQLAPAQGQVEEQTDEYKALIQTAGEQTALVACRLVLRGDFQLGQLDGAVTQAQRQMQVLHTFQRELGGKTMTWGAVGPAGPRPDQRVRQPGRPRHEVLVHAADDAQLLGAVLMAGMLDRQVQVLTTLQDIYQSKGQQFEQELVARLSSSAARKYEPTRRDGTPLPGDIVLFDGLAHVTMATGKGVYGPSPYGGQQVVSFWAAPFANNFGANTPAEVATTTIERILDWASTNGPGPMSVTFGAPSWGGIG
jgi:hypothetical protein